MVEFLLFSAYMLFGTASNLQRRHISLRRQTDAGQIDFAFKVSIYCFTGALLLLLFKPLVFVQPTSTIVILSLICGVFGAGSIALQYIAQRHVEAGVTILVGNVYTPIVILLSSMFLNETLNSRELFGTILLLFAVVLVSQKHRLSRWRFDKYFWMILMSGVVLGFCLVAERSLIKVNGITAGTLLSWGADTICLGIFAWIAGTKSQYNLRETTETGVLRYFLQISWVILVTVAANISLIASVTTFRIVIMFIAAAIILHERQDLKRKIIGSLIATAGLLLMI